jgi:hypothetical protein
LALTSVLKNNYVKLLCYKKKKVTATISYLKPEKTDQDQISDKKNPDLKMNVKIV